MPKLSNYDAQLCKGCVCIICERECPWEDPCYGCENEIVYSCRSFNENLEVIEETRSGKSTMSSEVQIRARR